MKTGHKRIIIALCIIALIILIRFSGLHEILTFDMLRQYRDQLLSITAQHYFFAAGLFIVIYIAVAALSIPGAAVLSLTAGFLFGFPGIIYVNIGATIGAIAAFLVARYLIGDWLQKRYAEKLASFNKEIAENGYNYLLTLRLVPIFPFFLVNILAGITRIPLFTYTWTTMIGIVPASFVFIYAGRQLGLIDRPGDVLSWRILLVLVLFGLLALSPVFLKKMMKNKNGRHLKYPVNK
ncbi:MAG: TVP38/TMEM64 family protein [Deltaproteobacteria bacterium HGW-Deltaproteobacteria-13]|jgi:uncharacterized membrane protein YdjX (TVP38/TMEM64 family)|nr:MAG: TVP38/TMEM64 family protein [Deltaproteobacteria bacterium HGW-Deltaproteobacteria-13]